MIIHFNDLSGTQTFEGKEVMGGENDDTAHKPVSCQ